jgi:hypothetical protein
MAFDPIAGVIEVMNKLDFISNQVPPSLKKNKDLIAVERFKRMVVGKNKNMANSKYEIIKLMQGSKEHITIFGIPSNMTYERLAQKLEDILQKQNYYAPP